MCWICFVLFTDLKFVLGAWAKMGSVYLGVIWVLLGCFVLWVGLFAGLIV